MPARSIKHRKSVRREVRKPLVFAIVLFVVFVIITAVIYFKISNSYEKDKLIVAIKRGDGSVNVVVFDKHLSEITDVSIPGNIETDAAHELGVWKLKSLWELGDRQGMGGEILTKSIIKYFNIPVYFWAEEPAYGFVKGGILPVLLASLSSYKTNLSIPVRVKLGLFSTSIKNIDRKEIDLSESGYLKSTVLSDGEAGFAVSGDFSPSLLSSFTDPVFSGARAKLVDASGEAGISDSVGKLIGVMGGKVFSVVKERKDDYVCRAKAKDKRVLKLITQLLPCEAQKEILEGNFDLEIGIGSEFSKKY